MEREKTKPFPIPSLDRAGSRNIAVDIKNRRKRSFFSTYQF
jgi:hypothetical protein